MYIHTCANCKPRDGVQSNRCNCLCVARKRVKKSKDLSRRMLCRVLRASRTGWAGGHVLVGIRRVVRRPALDFASAKQIYSTI